MISTRVSSSPCSQNSTQSCQCPRCWCSPWPARTRPALHQTSDPHNQIIIIMTAQLSPVTSNISILTPVKLSRDCAHINISSIKFQTEYQVQHQTFLHPAVWVSLITESKVWIVRIVFLSARFCTSAGRISHAEMKNRQLVWRMRVWNVFPRFLNSSTRVFLPQSKLNQSKASLFSVLSCVMSLSFSRFISCNFISLPDMDFKLMFYINVETCTCLHMSQILKVNFVSETLTEIYCDNPGGSCSKSKLFSCKQDKARMEVAFTSSSSNEDGGELRIRSVRNITVNIGCSCVSSKIRLLKNMSKGPEE